MSLNFNLLKPSASMEVTRIANELKKMGRTVYPLSIGDTHFSPPKSIIERINNLPAAASHYTNSDGIDALRSQIAKTINGYDGDNVIIVPGLKQGFFYALQALQNKKVCVLEPAWLGYQATALLANYEYVAVNMYEENWLETLNSTAFDTIIVCVFNNPDGKILSKTETQAIVSSAKKNNAWIITDLIYKRFCLFKSFV